MYKRQGLGRYDVHGKQTPTAYCIGKILSLIHISYCIGKINIARHLEPAIPTECLVRLLAYHYGGEITRGRINGRIQTIEEMSALLAEMEQEKSFLQYRRRSDEMDRNNGRRDARYENNGQRPNNNYNNNGNHYQRSYQNNNNNNNYPRNNAANNNNNHYYRSSPTNNNNGYQRANDRDNHYPVSYTHLDVYKRQEYRRVNKTSHIIVL